MRSILVIALMANLLLSAWSGNLQGVIAGQGATVSNGPISILDSSGETQAQ